MDLCIIEFKYKVSTYPIDMDIKSRNEISRPCYADYFSLWNNLCDVKKRACSLSKRLYRYDYAVHIDVELIYNDKCTNSIVYTCIYVNGKITFSVGNLEYKGVKL